MLSQLDSLPLTRRLVARYLLCGLACLFTSLVFSLTLAWRGEFTSLAPITVFVPMVILLLGVTIVRKTIWLNSQIEGQLQKVATLSPTADFGLQPLTASDPAAIGWNAILERVSNSSAMADLESRLNESLQVLRADRLEQILNSLSDGFAITDESGRVTLCNNSLMALLGLESKGDLGGKTMDDLLLLATAGLDSSVTEKLRLASHPAVFEIHRGEELEQGVWRVARYPIVDDPITACHIWSIQDVTQRRLADQTRNQFVFTATHELRTPLANIKAYAETLALCDDITIEKQKTFCNTINSEATRVSRFVDELLSISQMESGGLSLNRKETDVARLISEIIENSQPQMDQKRIDFETEIPPKLPELVIDKDKVSAALVNILGNAAKYTPEGGRVRFYVTQDKNSLQFHVEDSGVGIAESELPKVFDKFFRSSDDRVRDITGSGLGLAFVSEVARLHEGKVTVHSELDKGSKFSLILPA